MNEIDDAAENFPIVHPPPSFDPPSFDDMSKLDELIAAAAAGDVETVLDRWAQLPSGERGGCQSERTCDAGTTAVG